MSYDHNFLHNILLKKSEPFKFLSREIKTNGLIKLKKTRLDFFTFLFQTIISQQISNKAAGSIWKNLCDSLKVKNPSIKDFSNTSFLLKKLDEIRVSRQKKNYITSIYETINKNELILSDLKKLSDETVKQKLIKIKGVGNWTCDMILIFFFLRPNILPENDLIIKKTLNKISRIEGKKINFKKKFDPYLSIFSLHLWKMAKRIL